MEWTLLAAGAAPEPGFWEWAGPWLASAVSWALDPGAFQDYKRAVEYWLDLDKDALHILAGLLVFALAVLWPRQTIAKGWALVPVLIVALLAELLDIYDTGTMNGWQVIGWNELSGGLHDIVVTLSVPVVLVLLARWHPGFQPSSRY